ncbi:FmdB family zinc ribbon protein [Salinispora oceanensis]|uniref:FmdB family zinc ribbon protein n=1 Tax=Salinispora oceanensis TaxID=1050199 RepID=UPI00039B32CF|nr:zinc ribbon domain-containing protein [Salinispora oceanensis]
MPRYEFRCRACGNTFEVNRPMARAAEPARCPQGHDDTVKLLSTVATISRSGFGGTAPTTGGGCCGGGCGC